MHTCINKQVDTNGLKSCFSAIYSTAERNCILLVVLHSFKNFCPGGLQTLQCKVCRWFYCDCLVSRQIYYRAQPQPQSWLKLCLIQKFVKPQKAHHSNTHQVNIIVQLICTHKLQTFHVKLIGYTLRQNDKFHYSVSSLD